MNDDPIRVLVVDDRLGERRRIKQRLQECFEKYFSSRASHLTYHDLGNPQEVKSLAESLRRGETNYHFIFSDVFMPLEAEGAAVKEGGWRQLFAALRQRYKNRDTPV